MWLFNKKSALLVIALSLLGSKTIMAQGCNIVLSGKVIDEHDGSPLSFAGIYVEELQKGVVSDTLGYFNIKNLCRKSYHLKVTHIGCESKPVFISINTDTLIEIKLEHHTHNLKDVKVEGKGNYSTQHSNMLSGLQLNQNTGKSLASIADNISGVSMIKNGTGISKPVIHGLYGNRIAILNNGIPQAGQQWGNDHAPEIDPFTTNQLSVIKGAGSVEYGGNHLGGIIITELGKIKYDPHLHGSVNYVLASNGITNTLSSLFEKSGKWFSWRLINTAKYGGDRHTPDYFLTNTGVREFNSAIQLEKQLNKKNFTTFYYSFFNTKLGILRGSHISNLTDLNAAIDRNTPFFTSDTFSFSIAPPHQKVQHHLFKWSYKYFWTEYLLLKVDWGTQLNRRQEFDVRRSGRSEMPALDLKMLSNYTNISLSAEKGSFKYKSGIQYRYIDNVNNPQTGILPLVPDYQLFNPSAFGNIYYSRNKASYELGGRYDINHFRVARILSTKTIEHIQHSFQNYSVVAGASYNLTSNFKSTLNIGLTKRSPEINELYSFGLHQGVASIEEGNRSLVPELSFKTIWTNTLSLKEKLWLETSLYYQPISNYIYLEPQLEPRLTIRGAYPFFIYSQNDVVLRGFDLSSKYELSESFDLSLQYSIVRGNEQVSNKFLIYMPADNISSKISYRFNSIKKFNYPEIALKGKYVFKQNRFNSSQDLLPPPDAYFLLNTSFGTSTTIRSHELNLSVEINNLLNQRYRDYLNRLRYYANEEGINIVLRLKYNF